MRWSIRTKILLVLSALLLFVVVSYLILAERIFREDKELLVFDTNRASTQQMASEVEISLRRGADRLEMLAQLTSNPSRESRALARNFFDADTKLLLFQFVRVDNNPKKNSAPRILHELISESRLKKLRLTSQQVHSPDILKPPQSSMGGPDGNDGMLMDNRSIGSTPLYLIRIPVKFKVQEGEAESAPRNRYYVQAVFDGQNWLTRLRTHQGLAFTFAVTAEGKVLIHPNVDLVIERKDMSQIEPVRQALSDDFAVRQIEFTQDGKRYLGIYQKTDIASIIVISMTDKAAALAARGLLLEKTLYLSLFIFTIVFLISLFFASSLSTPLLRLVKATKEIASGNFDTSIIADTGDEIGVLARSFSQMGRELKYSRLLLERSNSQLEDKVQHRTQELEERNADIRRQQDAVLKATRLAAVGEIAGQAAHEVLNPLTAMISRLEAISARVKDFSDAPRGPLPAFNTIVDHWEHEYQEGGIRQWSQSLEKGSTVFPDKKMMDEDLTNLRLVSNEFATLSRQLNEDLDLLLKESHRIGRIVDGMRGLSRSAKLHARSDITVLLSDCLRVNRDLLARYRIRTETQMNANSTFVYIDCDEMRQVFSNLIKNSMDAIEQAMRERKHEGRISISVMNEGDFIKIRIRDNGIGIPLEDRDLVFSSDFTTKGAEGTGFGLSICRRFVREAGGELIVLDSAPGEFTEFEITLPLATTEVLS